jgi:predicted ATP-dependent endonuclease of OLD family
LFDVLSDIQRATGNQMILATHSASFISPDSFGKIKRVARTAGESHVVSLEATEVGDRKDLLHLINSHNNEKLFFADKVVLVEGIQDRLVVERLLREMPATKSDIIEVLEVYGKGNFPKYRQLLNSIKVSSFIIADRDYAEQIADEAVKKLFADNLSEVGKSLGRSKSFDRQALTAAIDAAMKSKQWDEVAQLWEYIVARHRSLKNPLTPEEGKVFDAFLTTQKKDRTFVLSAGAIEEYLPSEKTSLDATVELTAAADFMAQMATTGARLDELRAILKAIIDA